MLRLFGTSIPLRGSQFMPTKPQRWKRVRGGWQSTRTSASRSKAIVMNAARLSTTWRWATTALTR